MMSNPMMGPMGVQFNAMSSALGQRRMPQQQDPGLGYQQPDLGLSKQQAPQPGQNQMTSMYMNALDGQDPMAQAVGQRRRRIQSKGMF
jgi:hypothetical protein